ncbi:MAG: HlyD family efflux transporter periplasmic adaptor subunit [Planctomycetota bacterium]
MPAETHRQRLDRAAAARTCSGRLPALLLFVLVVACGGEPVVGVAESPRAVVTTELTATRPRSETLTTGIVEPFRVSELSFDVSGLVTGTLDAGEFARGPQLDGGGELLVDAGGEVVRRGAVVATLDATRFRQSLAGAERAIATTERRIESARVEIERVVSAQLANAQAGAEAAKSDVVSAQQSIAVAEADLDLASSTVERDRVLIKTGAVAQSVLDSSEAQFRTATAALARESAALQSALKAEAAALANISEIQGSVLVKEADIVTLQAQLEEQRVDLERARTDVESCTLRAPFDGRVTRKLATKGDYVVAGTSIVELTLISPVKVALTASGDQERELGLGAGVSVYADASGSDGELESTVGTVFEKTSVADAGTRTFRIGLIALNPEIRAKGMPADGSSESLSEVFPVVPLVVDGSEGLYVSADCVYEEGGRSYVLRLSGFQTRSKGGAPVGPQVPEVTEVELDDAWEQIDAWTLRRLRAPGDLEDGDALVRNPTPADRDGVTVGSRDFLFRPGDVVRVGLDAALPPVGYWLPVSAILSGAGQRSVFVARDGRARQVVVDVNEASGDKRRVTAPDLIDGAQVILSGVTFLRDGDPVSIVAATNP